MAKLLQITPHVGPAIDRAIPEPLSIDKFMQLKFPLASPQPLTKSNAETDILIAGCGTGRQPIITAGFFPETRLLAIDLSLTSQSYAKRKSMELGITNIEYAQADILQLGEINRRFDLIESIGVLHHLTDPWAGWQVLLSLLRPGGLMKLGFYSKIARRQIVHSRTLIAEGNYGATPGEIRRCRQDLIALDQEESLGLTVTSSDFFSTSACRDLFSMSKNT